MPHCTKSHLSSAFNYHRTTESRVRFSSSVNAASMQRQCSLYTLFSNSRHMTLVLFSRCEKQAFISKPKQKTGNQKDQNMIPGCLSWHRNLSHSVALQLCLVILNLHGRTFCHHMSPPLLASIMCSCRIEMGSITIRIRIRIRILHQKAVNYILDLVLVWQLWTYSFCSRTFYQKDTCHTLHIYDICVLV